MVPGHPEASRVMETPRCRPVASDKKTRRSPTRPMRDQTRGQTHAIRPTHERLETIPDDARKNNERNSYCASYNTASIPVATSQCPLREYQPRGCVHFSHL